MININVQEVYRSEEYEFVFPMFRASDGAPITGLTFADASARATHSAVSSSIALDGTNFVEIGSGYYKLVWTNSANSAFVIEIRLNVVTDYEPVNMFFHPMSRQLLPIIDVGETLINTDKPFLVIAIGPDGQTQSGIAYDEVYAAVVKEAGGVDLFSPTALQWTEVGYGVYLLTVTAALLDVIGTVLITTRSIVANGNTMTLSQACVVEVLSSTPGGAVFYDAIRDSHGNPVIGAAVDVFQTGTTSTLWSTRTSSTGQYSIPLASVAPYTLVDIRITPVGAEAYTREGVFLG